MNTVQFEYLALKKNCRARILDIGCGSGRHTAAAYDLDIGMVIGADAHIADLEEARSRLQLHAQWCPHHNSHWTLAAMDICALPLRSGVFDLVLCSEVLEHIADYRKAIEESVRVLKPGGILVVSVPRRWPEAVCWALSKPYRNSAGGHIRIFRMGQLVRYIQSLGLSAWRTHYAHSLHTPYWWLKCLIGLDQSESWLLKAYHRLLVWDMMCHPPLTRWLERLLDPVLGKSVVVYFQKTLLSFT